MALHHGGMTLCRRRVALCIVVRRKVGEGEGEGERTCRHHRVQSLRRGGVTDEVWSGVEWVREKEKEKGGHANTPKAPLCVAVHRRHRSVQRSSCIINFR